MARLAPISLARPIARSIAAAWPDNTTWLGSLSLATSQTCPPAAAAAIFFASSRSAPSSAAIVPTPTGTAACIAWPRILSSFAVFGSPKEPAAHKAEYSPRLWPATNCAALRRSTPPSLVSTANTATAWAMIAACAFSVSLSSSSGPSLISLKRCWFSASSTSPNTSRAAALASARPEPMPTAWLPCPGKRNARMVPLFVYAFAGGGLGRTGRDAKPAGEQHG